MIKQEHALRKLILTTKYAEYFEKHIIKVQNLKFLF